MNLISDLEMNLSSQINELLLLVQNVIKTVKSRDDVDNIIQPLTYAIEIIKNVQNNLDLGDDEHVKVDEIEEERTEKCTRSN